MIVITLFKLSKEDFESIKSIEAFIEIRLDCIDLNDENIEKLKQIKQKKIFSFRRHIDGGKKNINEEKRLQILKKSLKYNPDFIDIESDIDISFYKYTKENYPQIQIISSFHDMQKTPEDIESFFLKNIFDEEKNKYIDLYKTVFFANSSIDSLRLLLFLKKYQKKFNLIAHSMGEKGYFTRIIAKIFGSFFTYCTLDEKNNLLYQLHYEEQVKRYRYFKLNEKTKIFALIGKNLEKSVSHITHNKIFDICEKNAIYIKMELEEKELPIFFNIFKKEKLPFLGLSVTHPYKGEITKYIKNSKRKIVNTVYKKGKKFQIANTDGIGMYMAISKYLNFKKLSKIVILGASNTSFAFLDFLNRKSNHINKDMEIVLINRSKEKLVFFKKYFEKKGFLKYLQMFSFENIPLKKIKNYDLFLNATSSIDPGFEIFFEKNKYVFDVNVKPYFTPFLKKAKNKEMKIIHGIDLFIKQAIEQFTCFFDSYGNGPY